MVILMKTNTWQRVRFEEICRNVSTRINDPKNSGYDKYVGLEHLDTLESKIMRWGSTQDIESSMTSFKSGQILFGRRNWYLRRVAVSDFDGICSADIYVLEPIKGKIIPEFLPIFMHSEKFFQKNMMYSTGSMSTRVKWSNLAKLEFEIPSIEEQKSIVSTISKIDDLISKTHLFLQKLSQYHTSKMNSLLTKSLQKHPLKKVKWHFGKTISIPKHWELIQLNDVCKKITDGSHFSPKKVKEGLPLATVENIKNSQIDISSCYTISQQDFELLTKNGCKAEIGDVLFSKDGTIGLSFVFNQNIDVVLLSSIAIIKTSEKLDPTFCSHILQSQYLYDNLYKFTTGTALKRVILKNLKKILFPLPPIDEQKEISQILTILLSQKLHFENYLQKLQSLRLSVINTKCSKKSEALTIVQ